ncbi:uncharacterized protein K444DRAFT_133882 [Hyaloscypha bicolor E]|uniref:CFEM domain-containing protein n=1 Tax=Hyaloscypha bicolor E TaxID=1095630 RepID=A0A2J6STF1_9HELO|nr:uncharacterized protein K444DRAFT_133882 [Hyaloscypha bicolor E]PMD54019.1 hypothetical protein K444DRAFT_133882 [Hyaloscypha bicolor E]
MFQPIVRDSSVTPATGLPPHDHSWALPCHQKMHFPHTKGQHALSSFSTFSTRSPPSLPSTSISISAAGCAPTDMPCQCGLSAGAVGPCLTNACNATDLQQALTVGVALCSSYSATHRVSSTAMPGNMTSSSVLSTSSKYSNTTTVTAKTTSFTSTKTTRTAGSGSTPNPTSTVSKAGAPALVAGIGGVVGMLGLVAAL